MRSSIRFATTNVLIAALLTSPVVTSLGCATGQTTSRDTEANATTKTTISYKERTAVRFLSKGNLDEYADNGHSAQYAFPGDAAARKDFRDRLDFEFGRPDDRSPALIAVAVFLTGYLIKFVVNKLKEEADQHQASFDGRGSSSFYFADVGGRSVPNVDAIEFRRDAYKVTTTVTTTDSPEGPKKTETVTEERKANNQLLIVLARPPRDSSTNGLYSLRPIYFQENQPRAKVDDKRVMSSVITVSLGGAWMAGAGAVNAPLVEYKFSVQKYKVGEVEKKKSDNLGAVLTPGQAITKRADMDIESEWFAVPIRPNNDAVAMNAEFAFTEVDNGKAAENLKWLADFLNDGKSTVVDLTKKALEN